ncbi:site-specific DNA-methyltransferase [Lactococcus insecticola]|uniref:DNA methylase N-4/N-6 domain-containing protein n=1 Tax=Pseudolactococcus insecticola TaxID=2709158 RepID=A0A6A0B5B7_9LACT|nr:site-specific DNA-methyltransferase [Lactococcus insecticola]GFH40216.1 hypothetical protein Hs20B_06140 [Lactococcus insecticola]
MSEFYPICQSKKAKCQSSNPNCQCIKDNVLIDPPYNTGKDFVYHDNFKQTQKEADIADGSVDEYGNRLVKNEKSNGRYHSDWLSMMYPRLKLARNLLSDTGVIFVSIDDNEQANLKLLMDEVFGEDNFVASVPVISNLKGNQDQFAFAGTHEYLVVTSKNVEKAEFGNLSIDDESINDWEIDDNGYFKKGANLKSTGVNAPREKRPNLFYPVYLNSQKQVSLHKINDDDIELLPITNGQEMSWRWSKEKMSNQLYDVIVTNSENGFSLYKKQRPELGDLPSKKPKSVFYKPEYSSGNGTNQIKNLLGDKLFSSPKAVDLIKDIIQISTDSGSLILDFFAGSGTTADAAMQLNKEDGGNRKFIVATLDEETPENSEARKAGYSTIDQISRERIRRAAAKIGDTSGFRALKVDKVGIKEDVFKTADNLNQESLLLDVDNQADERSDFDLLYDVLVDGALEYNRQISNETINDEETIKYDYFGELSGVIAYFGDNLTDELTREIAKLKPLIAVFKETTFNKSADKVNVLEQFRIISPDTKVKVI